MALPDTTVTVSRRSRRAFLYSAGQRAAINNLPRFCRVAATTKPAVKFEVWLPLANWNGKFQGVGNGANAGSIVYGAMATATQARLRHGEHRYRACHHEFARRRLGRRPS